MKEKRWEEGGGFSWVKKKKQKLQALQPHRLCVMEGGNWRQIRKRTERKTNLKTGGAKKKRGGKVSGGFENTCPRRDGSELGRDEKRVKNRITLKS